MLNSCSTLSHPISPLLPQEVAFIRKSLKKWFLTTRRNLPWRQLRDPYATWVAEVMLQQTQSAVVIPYFNKWMSLFPTIESLAKAPQEQVLKAWEGLGYYTRAKNLHEGAKQLYQLAAFPSDESSLLAIKGIGPYTAKAILSFAFRQKAAPVDGNVARVISRLFAIDALLEKSSTKKLIDQLSFSLLPEEEPHILAESLIELGATHCQKKARCEGCPVQKVCLAYRTGREQELPKVKPRAKTTHLHRMVAVIECKGHFLMRNQEANRVMEYLLEFPYLEESTLNALIDHFSPLSLTLEKTLTEQSHGFTRYQAHLTPYYFKTEHMVSLKGYTWHSMERLKSLPFSSGHRKIFEELCE